MGKPERWSWSQVHLVACAAVALLAAGGAYVMGVDVLQSLARRQLIFRPAVRASCALRVRKPEDPFLRIGYPKTSRWELRDRGNGRFRLDVPNSLHWVEGNFEYKGPVVTLHPTSFFSETRVLNGDGASRVTTEQTAAPGDDLAQIGCELVCVRTDTDAFLVPLALVRNTATASPAPSVRRRGVGIGRLLDVKPVSLLSDLAARRLAEHWYVDWRPQSFSGAVAEVREGTGVDVEVRSAKGLLPGMSLYTFAPGGRRYAYLVAQRRSGDLVHATWSFWFLAPPRVGDVVLRCDPGQ